MVWISAVGTCIAKLKPLVEKLKNKKQVSSDRNAPTCKARLLWCVRFSFWLHLITVGDAGKHWVQKKIIVKKEGKLPKYFDPANLTNLFVDKFVTWDKVHRKSIPVSGDGYVSTPYKDHIMKFPFNKNWKLDVSNGTYSREKVTLKRCKYTDEVRLCLGVYVMTPVIDGVEQPQ